MLDDGRLTDNKGRIANFKNTIIIMTSNVGSHVIQERFSTISPNTNIEELTESTRSEVFELMKKSVRPEFLNRIDEIVMFTPLTKSEIRKIVSIQFKGIQNRLLENGIELQANSDVLDLLGDLGYDPVFGARPLKRVIQREILNILSKEIISGNIKRESMVGIILEKGKIKFLNLDEVTA